MSSAVVLSSGGINSAVILEIALRAHRPNPIHMLSFKYESKSNSQDRVASLDLYEHYISENVAWNEIELPDLFNEDIPTFLDATMLSITTTYAHNKKASRIYTGINGDHAVQFLGSIAAAITIGTHANIQLKFPLIYKSKVDVLDLAYELTVPANLTWSCLQPVKRHTLPPLHCGVCYPCSERIDSFMKLEVIDPTPYAIGIKWPPTYGRWQTKGEKQLRAGKL